MNRTRVGTTALLFFILCFKGWIVSFFVPAGGIPLEVYHYRVADSKHIAETIPGGTAGIIRKELSRLIGFAVRVDGTFERRNRAEGRKLTADLRSPGAETLVTTTPYVPAISEFPGYYRLLSVMLAPLRRLEIRWRWIVLRLFQFACMATACLMIMQIAGLIGINGWMASVWSGYVFVFGPGFGLDGILLGIHAILTCFWAFFIWRSLVYIRSHHIFDAALMIMTAYALSSIHLHGFVALVVSALVFIISLITRSDKNRLIVSVFLMVALAGIAIWLVRGIYDQDFISEEYAKVNSVIEQLFSRSTWNIPPLTVLPYLWSAAIILGLIGIIAAVRSGGPIHFLYLVIVPIFIVSGAIALIDPDIFMAWGALGPPFALIMGLGLSSMTVRYRGFWIMLVIIVFADLYDLLHQLIGIFS